MTTATVIELKCPYCNLPAASVVGQVSGVVEWKCKGRSCGAWVRLSV